MKKLKGLASLIISAALCLAIFAGCSSGEKEENSGLSGKNSPSRPVRRDYNYLTGMPLEDGEDPSARPIAVMINNARIALPQYGLENADIIYEAATEGGITRLMALYSHLEDVGRTGPVRSARDRFIELMLPLNAIYVHIGSSTSARRMLNFYSYQDIDGIYLGFASFRYDSELAKTKSREHCWFTDRDLIQAGIDRNNISVKNSFYPAFDFAKVGDTTVPADGEAVKVSFAYSDYADVAFDYDRESGKYKKSAFGVPHTDAATGNRLAFDNVFIIGARVGLQPENGVLLDFDMTGGEGYYFCGGRYEKITWEKGEPESPLLIYDNDGDILKVNPGKSYVGLIDRNLLPGVEIAAE